MRPTGTGPKHSPSEPRPPPDLNPVMSGLIPERLGLGAVVAHTFLSAVPRN